MEPSRAMFAASTYIIVGEVVCGVFYLTILLDSLIAVVGIFGIFATEITGNFLDLLREVSLRYVVLSSTEFVV